MGTALDSLVSDLQRVAQSLVATGTVSISVGDSRLGWHRADKMFSFMASDLRWSPGKDVVITNPKTGKAGTYTRPKVTRDRERDVQYWDLRGPSGSTLRIWND